MLLFSFLFELVFRVKLNALTMANKTLCYLPYLRFCFLLHAPFIATPEILIDMLTYLFLFLSFVSHCLPSGRAFVFAVSSNSK